jgi:hypothetical protein
VITTPELIEVLAASAKPVRPLQSPIARTALWLLLAAGIFVLLALSRGVRPDLVQQAAQPIFVTGILASLATGILAAVASFMVSLPDRSRAWILLPVPALLIWVSTVSYGCLTNWISVGPEGIRLGDAAQCFATLLLVSLPLSLALYAMLRHGLLLQPVTVTATGALAVAAFSASALSLFHAIDATVMVLIWTLGLPGLLVALGALLGRKFGVGLRY